jgi:hypothetical protein
MMMVMGSSNKKDRDETAVLGKQFIGKKITMTGGGYT